MKMNQNSVNDRNVTMQEQDFQKHLLRRTYPFHLEGYEGWMIGTTTLHLDWQPKQGENEFCHTKLTPEIHQKRSLGNPGPHSGSGGGKGTGK